MSEREEIHVYFEGVKEGIWRFAWWRDGVQYVGTSGTTLKQALADVDKECNKQMEGLPK